MVKPSNKEANVLPLPELPTGGQRVRVCYHPNMELIRGTFASNLYCPDCNYMEEAYGPPPPSIVQEGKCTTCDYAKSHPVTIAVRTEDHEYLWTRQGPYCKEYCGQDAVDASLRRAFARTMGMTEEEYFGRNYLCDIEGDGG